MSTPARRLALAGVALAPCLAACRISPTGSPAEGPFHDGDPEIVGLALTCEQAEARWALLAETDAWTGGAVLIVAGANGEVERHPIEARRSDGDGGWDCLQASLSQSADRAGASPGTSTRWFCEDAPELSFLFVVNDPTDLAPTDCRAWGADPEIFADLAGLPPCDQIGVADAEGRVEVGFSACP